MLPPSWVDLVSDDAPNRTSRTAAGEHSAADRADSDVVGGGPFRCRQAGTTAKARHDGHGDHAVG